MPSPKALLGQRAKEDVDSAVARSMATRGHEVILGPYPETLSSPPPAAPEDLHEALSKIFEEQRVLQSSQEPGQRPQEALSLEATEPDVSAEDPALPASFAAVLGERSASTLAQTSEPTTRTEQTPRSYAANLRAEHARTDVPAPACQPSAAAAPIPALPRIAGGFVASGVADQDAGESASACDSKAGQPSVDAPELTITRHVSGMLDLGREAYHDAGAAHHERALHSSSAPCTARQAEQEAFGSGFDGTWTPQKGREYVVFHNKPLWGTCFTILDDTTCTFVEDGAAHLGDREGNFITWTSGEIWRRSSLADHYAACDRECPYESHAVMNHFWTARERSSRDASSRALLSPPPVEALPRKPVVAFASD